MGTRLSEPPRSSDSETLSPRVLPVALHAIRRETLAEMRAWALVGVLGVLVAGCAGGEDEVAAPTRNDRAENVKFPRIEDNECPQAGAISLPGISGEGALGPSDPRRPNGPKLGRGPIYAMLPGAPRFVTLSFPDEDPPRSSSAALIAFISKSSYDGPALVDGRRLDGPGQITFGGREAQRSLELPRGSWADADGVERARVARGRRIAQVTTDFPAEGCYGLRVSGDGFGYVLPVLVFGN